ncbi:MAG: NAD-dependent epimerase/dehydratase family protein [Bacteroidota bacterium]
MLEDLRAAGTENLDQLQLVEADLTQDDPWDAAVAGCQYILHVASPFPYKMPKDEEELVRPAVEGTLRVLRAAGKHAVQRVVMTSSFAAVGYTYTQVNRLINEDDWTNPDDPEITAYTKSKTLAERAAWDYVQQTDPSLELAVICPRFILGPSMGSRFTTSLSVIQDLVSGKLKRLPQVGYGIIDVRDVADLHLRAMSHPQAGNERFLATTDGLMTLKDIALFLKQELGAAADPISTQEYPNWVVRLAAWFDPVARGVAPHLGKALLSKNDKASRLLGWNPRTKEEAILAAVKSIQQV